MEEFATFKSFIIIIAIGSAIILFQLISTVIAAVIGSKTIAKDKSSVFLGYSLITAAASQFLSIFTGVAARTVLLRYVLNVSNFNLFASGNYAISFAIMAMNTAFTVLLCLHFIKNYKLGKAHLTVILIASVLTLCAVLAGNLATGQYVTGKISFGLYVAINLISVFLDAVPVIAIINLCSKAKGKERRKLLFVFPLLLYICSTASKITVLLLCDIAGSNNGTVELLLLLFPVLPAIILIIEAIYIYMTRKK